MLKNLTPTALAFTLAWCAAAPAQAAPYELTVYSDDIAAPGETELETTFSVARPRSAAVSTSPVGQMLLEVTHGLAPGLAIGIELPAVYTSQTRKLQGMAMELHYVAPHNKAGGWFWGVRGGLGRIASVYEDDTALSVEINPIIGYRGAGHRLLFNPSVEKALRGPERALRFEPSAKWAVRASGRTELGLEYFADWGPTRQLLPPPRRNETLYLVWDHKAAFGSVSVGLGQALRPRAGSDDKWVLKLGLQFDAD